MGGFVKVTLRDENKITTSILDTKELSEFLGNANNIFEKDIHKDLIKKRVTKEYLFKEDYKNMESLSPFNYGYIFIDRINKYLFYINNYTSFSYYSPLDFDKKDFKTALMNNYKYKISTYGTDKIETYDLRKHFCKLNNLGNYYRLYNSLNYIDSITKAKETIKMKDLTFESIIGKVVNERTPEDQYSLTSEFSINWKEWTVYDHNKDFESYNLLFDYLQNEKILNKKDLIIWNLELEELENNEKSEDEQEIIKLDF